MMGHLGFTMVLMLEPGLALNGWISDCGARLKGKQSGSLLFLALIRTG
jgi:hypothetical protein